eukprot:4688826-Prymnesium_polylepis.1
MRGRFGAARWAGWLPPEQQSSGFGDESLKFWPAVPGLPSRASTCTRTSKNVSSAPRTHVRQQVDQRRPQAR